MHQLYDYVTGRLYPNPGLPTKNENLLKRYSPFIGSEADRKGVL
jgi:hypothetical protein